jgi:signal transduction histidine kinase
VKILVIDDYPANVRLLRAALESVGHEIVDACNGAVALEILSRQPVDAVISDVLMPTMDGFRLCQEIRKDASLCALPVILYTSTYDSPTDRTLAETVGADAYVLKPAPISVLLKAISNAQGRPRLLEPARDSPLDRSETLERYNAALVRKLESRNDELQKTLASLNHAHSEILELNRTLETRVAQRTAQLDAANRELEAFSYSVSHDLQAPIRHITGFAQLLELDASERLTPDDLGQIARIVAAAQKMHALIEGLLKLAQTARAPVLMVEVDLEALLDGCIGELAPDVAGRSIEWRRARLPNVLGDAVLLRQVLINLLSNAIKYTRTQPRAVIEIGQRGGRANEAVVFIKDNGVGFDMDRTGELFGVFKRLHSADAFEGTGIGLANVQRIITRLGGTVWAEGAVDQGATFYFSLPRPEPAAGGLSHLPKE